MNEDLQQNIYLRDDGHAERLIARGEDVECEDLGETSRIVRVARERLAICIRAKIVDTAFVSSMTEAQKSFEMAGAHLDRLARVMREIKRERELIESTLRAARKVQRKSTN